MTRGVVTLRDGKKEKAFHSGQTLRMFWVGRRQEYLVANQLMKPYEFPEERKKDPCSGKCQQPEADWALAQVFVCFPIADRGLL